MINTHDNLVKYRQAAEEREAQILHPKAALSKDHQRFEISNDDHRLAYKRDVDRIVHSKAFPRYADKTQVVYLVENDHITHRSLHVQLVSNFARGIGGILNLNLDLIEAISLGHDVGHPPFGHEGEGHLSELSEEYGNGKFSHPWQSCRLFTDIEPLNLGLAVYDGFLSHDDSMSGGTVFKPQYGKTWDEHFKERGAKIKDPDVNVIPATLEGCLVKIGDTMSYMGRDIEDAISLGILERSQVPHTLLGNNNRDILTVLAQDVISMSYGKDYIAVSDKVFEALSVLREFNFHHIYVHPKLKKESGRIQSSYRILFELLLEDLNKNQANSYIWNDFLHNKSEKYLANATPVQMVVDYIAGMTDSFFVRTLEALAIPRRIRLS